jgi:hypothetical protein
MLGEIHLAHPPGAQQADDGVPTKNRPFSYGHAPNLTKLNAAVNAEKRTYAVSG